MPVEPQYDPYLKHLFYEHKKAETIASYLGLDMRSLYSDVRSKFTSIHVTRVSSVLCQIILASDANATILRDYREAPLNSEQRMRACHEGNDIPSHGLLTKLTLVNQTGNSQQSLQGSETLCIFISDGGDPHETWTLIRELSVRVVRDDVDVEITVASGEEELATIAYDTINMVLSRCLGRVGLALELLFAMKCGVKARDQFSKGKIPLETKQIGKSLELLPWIVGVAAVSELVSSGGKFAIPSGASHWMPAPLLDRLLHLNYRTARNGFIDVREMGIESYVRAVQSAHVKTLCPVCWVISPESVQERTKDQTVVRPTHLKCAAAVGGPATLWIDRVCIDQGDDTEKNSEIPLIGSYYAGAHTTLICPAREVVDVPMLQPSRHMVAIPKLLQEYKGLKRWRQDVWHQRVWTYQEGALSKNPRIWIADKDIGMDARWLNFMSWAAAYGHSLKCDLGLPQYYQDLDLHPDKKEISLPWGEVRDEELWEYRNSFARSWTTCKRHGWVPNVDNIRTPLARLIGSTQMRRCTEPRDKILGILGLALSSDTFRTDMVRDLEDAYREAIRCGILGADILLYGWTNPGPRSWIPKTGSVERWPTQDAIGAGFSAKLEQPRVDQSGRLILRAYEVQVFDNDGFRNTLYPCRITHLVSSMGKASVTARLLGCFRSSVKKYILVSAEDKTSLPLRGGILVCAREVQEGNHVLEGACRIVTRTSGIGGLDLDKIDLADMTYLSLSADCWSNKERAG
ncbi:hypothetical protein G7054_g13201 [Neopestalotiopsis clavispora]|nr:hypothetical protein G7054_g13201 [Neopestalotiopsis clavispora]